MNGLPLLQKLREADLTRVFIGLGAGVDPDGLACQFAMEKIVRAINPAADIELFHRGDWDRVQNRTMREVLGLSPQPYSEFKWTYLDDNKACSYTTLIMVDGNISTMPEGFAPHFVIDHHDGESGALVADDVRLIGSCSAILWEYVMATDPSLLEGDEGARLATALAIGIVTDTDGKTAQKTSKLDWEAEAYCGIRCDIKAYAAIRNYQKPSYQKDMETKAWNDKVVEGNVLTTQLGVIPRERKGVISSFAEEFCGQGAVRTTLVAGLIDGDVHFSVRSFNQSINIDEFIRTKLTKAGGGKPGAGAGVITLPEICKGVPTDVQKQIFDAVFKAISHKTFEFAGDGVRVEDRAQARDSGN
ncbi:MAG: hypothetical protein MN733_34635 [Nitrososphaera sp.]|nr:hypothetical protein [Nitrososphaera sp.]